MSYCRWSSDNWKCDLYCYRDASGGYTIYVAARKLKKDIVPQIPEGLIDKSPKKWLRLHKKQMAFFETAEHEDIGLPFDGKCFNEPTLEEFLERILLLKGIGYNVPDYVVEQIRDELKETKSNKESN